MVKLEHNRVGFAAVDARALDQIQPDIALEFAPSYTVIPHASRDIGVPIPRVVLSAIRGDALLASAMAPPCRLIAEPEVVRLFALAANRTGLDHGPHLERHCRTYYLFRLPITPTPC